MAVIVAVALAVGCGVLVMTGELVSETMGVNNASVGAQAERNTATMIKPPRMRASKCRWEVMPGILL